MGDRKSPNQANRRCCGCQNAVNILGQTLIEEQVAQSKNEEEDGEDRHHYYGFVDGAERAEICGESQQEGSIHSYFNIAAL